MLSKLLFNHNCLILSAVLTAVPLLAQGQTPDKGQHKQRGPHTATSFIQEAAEGNLAEVQMGQLAEKKSQNAQVKQLAQRLVQDHSQANQQLQTLAQKQGTTWPTELNRRDKREYSRLDKLSGSRFDQEFARHQIRDHAQDINKYENAANNIQDPALKEYITGSIPKLQDHLKLAEQLGQSVGLSQQTISSLEKGYRHGMGAGGNSSGMQSGSSSQKDWNKDQYNNK